MSRSGDHPDAVLTALRRAAAARRRAARHVVTARLQKAHAHRLAAWAGAAAPRPRFLAGVGHLFGTPGVALTLVGSDGGQLSFTASDGTAAAAQDLEYVVGAGPAADAVAGADLVSAAGGEAERRWPGYGAGLAALGVTAVVAVPLLSGDECVGALSVFDPRPPYDASRAGGYHVVADVLTRLLLGPGADPELYGDTDHLAVVHQAAGMLVERTGCGVEDALTLIRARAFADGRTARAVAEQVVHQGLHLA